MNNDSTEFLQKPIVCGEYPNGFFLAITVCALVMHTHTKAMMLESWHSGCG